MKGTDGQVKLPEVLVGKDVISRGFVSTQSPLLVKTFIAISTTASY